MKVRGVIDPRREDGVAMTEFALVLPILMVIVAGMLGFGRVFYYWIQANHVANETARWAIVDQNPYGPAETLQVHAQKSATAEFADAKVCITRDGTELGDPLEVTVAKPFTFVPIMNIGTITIHASSTPRRSHSRIATSVLRRPCSNGNPIARSVARHSEPTTSATRIRSVSTDTATVTARQ